MARGGERQEDNYIRVKWKLLFLSTTRSLPGSVFCTGRSYNYQAPWNLEQKPDIVKNVSRVCLRCNYKEMDKF